VKKAKTVIQVICRAQELIKSGHSLHMAVSVACDEGGRMKDFVEIKDRVKKSPVTKR
jgi:hypothetical protein